MFFSDILRKEEEEEKDELRLSRLLLSSHSIERVQLLARRLTFHALIYDADDDIFQAIIHSIGDALPVEGDIYTRSVFRFNARTRQGSSKRRLDRLSMESKES